VTTNPILKKINKHIVKPCHYTFLAFTAKVSKEEIMKFLDEKIQEGIIVESKWKGYYQLKEYNNE
jgi:hypothetical protein